MTADLKAYADRLRELHHAGEMLVLPNVWDAASAKIVAEAGFPVVATASAAISAMLGYPDGEGAPWQEMFAAAGRVARAVSVPVTVDAEAGSFPEATQIVDLFHAREHSTTSPGSWSSCSATSARAGSPPAWRTWTTATSTASAPPPALTPFVGSKKDDLDKALAHFENNAPRMRYEWFRSRGLFAGPGALEAGCKAIVAQRLKLSGMRWTVAGADAIIALRCREASSQWEQIWQRPHNQTAHRLTQP